MPWRMSNRRNLIPQIVKFVRRIEAIEIQRALVNQFYGEGPVVDVEAADAMYDNEEEEPKGGGKGKGKGKGKGEDSEDEGEIVEVELEALETSEIHYGGWQLHSKSDY
ncbi:hypothetical protein FRC08_005991 [Ceratobasidium sp. 394]|nr:hypothetical protein FRC08_005991 [Ceratobasidium sp. 394]